MQALAWWAIPIIATSVAIVWAIFAARPKGPADAHRTVAEHLEFRSALQSGHVRVQPTDPPGGADPKADDRTEARPGGSADQPDPNSQSGGRSPRLS